MSGEERTIQARAAPVTRERLAADLRRSACARAACCSSTPRSRRSAGSAAAHRRSSQALLDALGPEGTLVVPTHTSGNSDPAEWRIRRCPRPGGR